MRHPSPDARSIRARAPRSAGRRRCRRWCPLAVLLARAILVLVGLLPAPVALGQFGQNKVQHRELRWSVLKTEHFEIYFRDGLREFATDAGRMAERAYARLRAILGHEVAGTIPVILYGSQSEFQQTNVVADFIGEGTGGFTEFTKRRVALPITGSYADFDHVLTHELVHAFQFDVLSGGGERSLLSPNSYAPPLWFVEGMSEYLSLGRLDPLTEMWLRDGALQGYLTPIELLERVGDIRVYRYGQAILAYLGNTYGDEVIGKILKRLPHDRSVARALEEVVGLTLRRFSEDWTEAMRRVYLPAIQDHRKPDDFASRLTDASRDRSDLNCSPAVSPDGDFVAYFSDRSLYNDLYIASALDGSIQRRLVKSERRADFESLRFFRSAMDWSPDGERIVFVAQSDGRDHLTVQRARDGKLLSRTRPPVDGVLSPAFSPDGAWIVFAGQLGGRSNLFRVRADGSDLEQLTDDRYLAQEPRYAPDGKRIVFVTDQGVETDFENLIFSPPRLAIFDLETRETIVLPAQAGGNISPHFFPDGRHLLFVSDRSGIANLWIRDLQTHEDRQITDILSGISGVTATSPAASLSRQGNRVVFSAFSRGTWDLFAIKDPLRLWESGVRWDGPYPSPARGSARLGEVASGREPTGADGPGPDEVGSEDSRAADSESGALRKADGAGDAAATLEAAPETAEVSGTPTPPARVSARLDSLWAEVDRLETPGPRDRTARPASPGDSSLGETPAFPLTVPGVFRRERTLTDTTDFRVRRYRPKFTADYVAANGFFAGNVGVAAQSLLQFSDMLGDQVIVVGANVYGSLSDSDLLLQYWNLKRRVNWGVSVYQFRNDYYIYAAKESDEFVSQVYRGASLVMQRPFSRFRRVEWSLDAQSVSEDVYRESFYSGQFDTRVRARRNLIYLAPGLALVGDNALWGSTGPMGGGRSRWSIETGIGDLSYHTFIGDARRYRNVRQNYALCLRVIGAASQGEDPQFFRIGGAYTLRGWPYGEFRGTRIGLANIELRFPLIEYLKIGFPLPVTLGGVRGVAFFDAGAAWTDSDRFRAFRTRDGITRLEDLRASYGVGARLNVGFTVLRWDLAWRTDLARTDPTARGFLSLGLDF